MKTSLLKSYRCAGLLAGLSFAGAVHAQEIPPPTPTTSPTEPSRVALVIEGGTTGVGPSLVFTLNPKSTLTVGYTWLDTDYDVESDDNDYDGKLNLSNFKAVANWHPWNGTFHFSGGVYATDNNVDVVARPKNGTTYKLNGNTYTSSLITSLSAPRNLKTMSLPT
ncbi:MAG: hypothetical protein QM760_12300 [Nibricoccus sp.]